MIVVFISFDIDVSERNIINSAIERDAKENLNRPPSARKNKHLQSVVDAINKCGVSFSVWQNRDVVRSVYHNKSNCHDACKEAVKALKKIDNLQDFERTSHKYTKKNEDYWLSEIYKQRRKRPRLCVDTRKDHETPLTPEEVDPMSLDEVKEKLKELQVKTKVRKLREVERIYEKSNFRKCTDVI